MKNNKQLVSIIVPAYNVANYIEKCVESILSQTYKNIEVIAINDGSTDSTEDVLFNIAADDTRLVVVSNPNKGVSKTRNDGIDYSHGEWLVFVDGDDYLSPDYVEHMLEVAESTKAEFCMTTDCYKYANDKQNNEISIKQLTPDKATALLLSTRVEVGCWNKMFRKDLLTRNNIRFDTSLFYGEGLYFITTLSQLSKCVGVSNKRVYYYRQDNYTSATKAFNIEKITNGWKSLDKIEKELNTDMVKSKQMLHQHRMLFSFVAVKKIIDSNSVEKELSSYKYHLNFLRKSFPSHVFDSTLSLKYKIRIAACCLAPRILPFYRRITANQKPFKSV